LFYGADDLRKANGCADRACMSPLPCVSTASAASLTGLQVFSKALRTLHATQLSKRSFAWATM
jgi:hypothetical protein